MKKIKICIITTLSSALLLCETTLTKELNLRERARIARLTPLSTLEGKKESLFQLGERLFFDKSLSGNRNISCASCHHPKHFSADGLMLGIGQGRSEQPHGTHQGHAKILKRHSPPLINLGYEDVRFMFWDGRVSFDLVAKTFKTPEPGLNGPRPHLRSIVKQLDNLLAAQALFPLLSRDEMRGESGDNDLAEDVPNEEVWKRVTQRVLNDSSYNELLKKAFPKVKSFSDLNIGHLAKAMGHFQKHFFNSTKTPFDNFMRGDDLAMSPLEKEGLKVFLSKGRCTACHNGPHFGNNGFRSSGAPQVLGPLFNDDLGRGEMRTSEKYMFKTSPLRNVALTAPYFHTGAFNTLEEVVEHYSRVRSSLKTYQIKDNLVEPYSEEITLDTNSENNDLRWLRSRPLHNGLKLSSHEKAALVEFLKVSLTDKNFKTKMENYQPPKYAREITKD